MKVVDLSGYMFSGKSAVTDILREFKGLYVPDKRSELDILRSADGLMDLKLAYEHWSPIRSDLALRRFKKLTEVFGRKPKTLMDKLFRIGYSYDEKIPNFNAITKEFVDKLSLAQWEMDWPYEAANVSALEIFFLKMKYLLFKGSSWPRINYHLTGGGADFLIHAKEYLVKLFSQLHDVNQGMIVTHNMLEPYSPESFFCFFDDIKVIIVDRDIRDIYTSSWTFSEGFNDNIPVFSKIIGAFDVDIFMKRQKLLRQKAKQTHKQILRLRFEDLVFSYEESIEEIKSFLGLSTEEHFKKGHYFKPKESSKTIGMWRNVSEKLQPGIKKIEENFPENLYYGPYDL